MSYYVTMDIFASVGLELTVLLMDDLTQGVVSELEGHGKFLN